VSRLPWPRQNCPRCDRPRGATTAGCVSSWYDLLLVLSVLGARAQIPERRSGFIIPAGLTCVWANALVVAATWAVVLCSTAYRQRRDARAGLRALFCGFLL